MPEAESIETKEVQISSRTGYNFFMGLKLQQERKEMLNTGQGKMTMPECYHKFLDYDEPFSELNLNN